MTRGRIAGALVLAALLALAYLSARPPPAGSATRASADAAFGGYAAWYELEAREGIAVSRFRRHHDALARERVDTLIVALPADGAPAFSAAERTALQGWVARGGHAVLAGGIPGLLAPAAAAGHGTGPLRGPWSALVGSLERRGRARLAPRRHVRVLLADAAGPLVARRSGGRGSYLEVADAALFENRALSRPGAARLAFLLAQPSAAGKAVAFDEAVRGDIVELPWYAALDVPERLALALLVLAGLAWLAGGAFALGPPLPGAPLREPTSAEFLAALAALYERTRARPHARDVLTAAALRAGAAGPPPAGRPDTDDALLAAARRLHLIRQEIARGHNRTHAPLARRPGLGGRRR